MMQIFRPPNHTDEDHRFALVFHGGDRGIEVYDQGGECYDMERVPVGWVEQTPRLHVVSGGA